MGRFLSFGSSLILPPKVLTSLASGGGLLTALSATDNTKATLSGALTATVLKSVLSVTGAGILAQCYLKPVDGTVRTIRIKVTVDGNVIFDASAAVSSAVSALVAVGGIGSKGADASYPVLPLPIGFNSSLDVSISSSLSETDKLSLQDIHWTC